MDPYAQGSTLQQDYISILTGSWLLKLGPGSPLNPLTQKYLTVHVAGIRLACHRIFWKIPIGRLSNSFPTNIYIFIYFHTWSISGGGRNLFATAFSSSIVTRCKPANQSAANRKNKQNHVLFCYQKMLFFKCFAKAKKIKDTHKNVLNLGLYKFYLSSWDVSLISEKNCVNHVA